tara:strand:- start:1163 stop:1360 length:198 start_codon:yes stop_codon:yes gene_type:complete
MKLDLHRTKHEDVDRLVENFVLMNKPPLTIITGLSHKMRRLVRRVLDRHNMKYEQWNNPGEYKIL